MLYLFSSSWASLQGKHGGVGVDVMIGGNGVEDEGEGAGVPACCRISSGLLVGAQGERLRQMAAE